jgi:hypothetical protein
MSPPPPEAPRRFGMGRILIAAIVLECVVLGAIQIRKWIGNGDRTTTSTAPAPDRPAGTSSVPEVSPAPVAGSAALPPPAQGRSGRESGRLAGPAADGSRPVTADPATASAAQPGIKPAAPPFATGPPGGVAAPGTTASGSDVRAPASSVRPFTAGAGDAHAGAPGGGAASNGVAASPTGPASTSSGAAMPTPSVVLPPGAVVSGASQPPAPSQTDPKSEEGKPDDEPEEPDDPGDDNSDDGSGSDGAPPVLESLRFDPAQVEGGSVTTLTVQASDVRSGMRSIWGEVRSPNRSAVIGFGSGNVGAGTAFTFPIAVPAAAQTGTWYVTWISLTDGAGNTKLIQAASASAAPPGGTFAAFSSDSDATPPEILRVWFDRSAVAPGEKNTITVEARDDRSGIASVAGACQSPSKSALVWFNGAVSEDSGTWTGEVTVPANADCGTWVVQQLAVKDKAGNTALIQANSPVLARAGFGVVSGSNCDFAAPTLEAFDLAPAAVPSGTATDILLTARVHDEGSGTAQVTGWFDGPPPTGGGQAPKNYFSCSADPGNPDSWTCRVQVPPAAARGTWKVGSIRLEDKARNARTYTSTDPAVSGRVFQVQ